MKNSLIEPKPLSDLERFVVRGYLAEQTTDNLLMAYRLSHPGSKPHVSKASWYNLSNRWLSSDRVVEYIQMLGFSKMRIGSRTVYVRGEDEEFGY